MAKHKVPYLRWAVTGLAAFFIVRWLLHYYPIIVWAFSAIVSLSPQGWLLSVITIVGSFFIMPRLFGLALSFIIFRTMASLPFEVSVGSASIGRLLDVTIRLRNKHSTKGTLTVRIAELGLVPWFLPLQAMPGPRKFLTAYVREVSATASIASHAAHASDTSFTHGGAESPVAYHHQQHRQHQEQQHGQIGVLSPASSSGTTPAPAEGERESTSGQKKAMSVVVGIAKAHLVPLGIRLACYLAPRLFGLLLVDTHLSAHVPELGVVKYMLEKVSAYVNWEGGSKALVACGSTEKMTVAVELEEQDDSDGGATRWGDGGHHGLGSSHHRHLAACRMPARRGHDEGLGAVSMRRHEFALMPCSIAVGVRANWLQWEVGLTWCDVQVGRFQAAMGDSLVWKLSSLKMLRHQRMEEQVGRGMVGERERLRGVRRRGGKAEGGGRSEGGGGNEEENAGKGVSSSMASRIKDGALKKFNSIRQRGRSAIMGMGADRRGGVQGAKASVVKSKSGRGGGWDSEVGADEEIVGGGVSMAMRLLPLLPARTKVRLGGVGVALGYELASVWNRNKSNQLPVYRLDVSAPPSAASIECKWSQEETAIEMSYEAPLESSVTLMPEYTEEEGNEPLPLGLGGGGERHTCSGLTVKAGLQLPTWPSSSKSGNHQHQRGGVGGGVSRHGGGVCATVVVELKDVSFKLEPLGITAASLSKLALPIAPPSVSLPPPTSSLAPEGEMRNGGLQIAHLAFNAAILSSRVELVMGRKDVSIAPYSFMMDVGEFSLQISSDRNVGGGGGRRGSGGGGFGMGQLVAGGVRLKGLEGRLVCDGGAWGEQVLLLETCAMYASLIDFKPATDDPITGEVSGLHVRMNRDVIEVLVSTESPPQKDRRDVREARVGGVEGERAGVGTTAVKIHLQNFTVRLGAGFGDKDGGRYGDKDGGRYGEMRFEMAKGVVQVVKEQRTHVTIELDRPSHELHHPCVSVGYLEWPGSEHDIYPRLADISQGENASEFSLRMPSQTPDFEHLFFCLHSLTLDYTSGGGGVAGGGIMHSSPAIHALTHGAGRHARHGATGEGRSWAWDDVEWTSGDEGWGGDDENSYNNNNNNNNNNNGSSSNSQPQSRWGQTVNINNSHSFSTPSRVGFAPHEKQQVPGSRRPPSWVSQASEEEADAEEGRVLQLGVSGVRLHWTCQVQYGIVEVLLVHKLAASPPCSSSASSGAAPSRARDKDKETNSTSSPSKAKEVGRTALHVHDIWMYIETSDRSILAVDVGHVLAGASIPSGIATPEVKGIVRSIAVHRVRDTPSHIAVQAADYAMPPPLNGPILSNNGFTQDCEDYSLRSLAGFESHSDTLLLVSRVAVTLPLTGPNSLPLTAYVEVEDVCVSVPMPANISMLGRKEGLKGRWERQSMGKEGKAFYTDLGCLVFDFLMAMKALQNRIKQRLNASGGQVKDAAPPKITEFPSIMPEINFKCSKFEVRFQDDGFEHWVGTFFRLRMDEAEEQRQREVMLLDKIRLWNKSGFASISDNAKQEMLEELQVEGARIWKRRVDEFKASSALRDPPPLLFLTVNSFETTFSPRNASQIIPHIERLDVSGMSDKSALWPKFDTVVGGQINGLHLDQMSIRIRDYAEPLVSIDSIKIGSQLKGQSVAERAGWLFATEEICPSTHKTIVNKMLHPFAPEVGVVKTFGTTKIWADVDVCISQPHISWGPCFMPAISVISLVAGGLSPPGFDPSPKLSSWDKARMMLHGRCALIMDQASLKLLSTTSPYEHGECFHMCGKPITVSYDCKLPPEGQLARVGRVKIQAEMVEWAVKSTTREMVSAMLLRKPLFKAVRLDITISLHWKCLGPSLAHHFTQILPKESYTLSEIFAAQKAMRKFNARRITRQKSEALSSAGKTASDAQMTTADGAGEGGAGGDAAPAKKPSLWERLAARNKSEGETSGAGGGEGAGAGAGEGVGASTTPSGPDALPFDTFRLFRSSALAMTVRVSTAAAQSVLHVNTIRWFRHFMEHFERDSDPVNRHIGSLEANGQRIKRLNEKSSFGKHVKAIHLLVLVKQPRLESFYVGEHRMVGGDTGGESASAKNVVVSFGGEKLQLQMRVGRLPKEAQNLQGGAVIPLEKKDEATGPWNVVEVQLETMNMLSQVVPNEIVGVVREKEKEGMPGHPIATAVKVTITSGDIDDEGGGDGEESGGAALAGNVLKVDNKELHNMLMRQKSMAFNINPEHVHPSLPQAAEEASFNGFTESRLKAVVQNLQNNSHLIGSMNYRFKEYRNVFLGTHFCDWAIREGYVDDRRLAVELGQACIDSRLIVPYIAGHDVFEDVPAFFRVRGNRHDDEEAPDDSEWSKMFASQKKKVESNKDEKNAGNQGPQFKLVLSRVCIQWTLETREVINEWFTLLTLATRQHQRPKHPTVVPEAPVRTWQPRNIDVPKLSSEMGPGVYPVKSPNTPGGLNREQYLGCFPSFLAQNEAELSLENSTIPISPLDDSDQSKSMMSMRGLGTLGTADTRTPDMSHVNDTSRVSQHDSSILGPEVPLVQHLIRTAQQQQQQQHSMHHGSSVRRPSAEESSIGMGGHGSSYVMNFASTSGYGSQQNGSGVGGVAGVDADAGNGGAPKPKILFHVHFDDVQLGVETEEETIQVEQTMMCGVERLVLAAKSATMHKIRLEEPGATTMEKTILSVNDMLAFVVFRDNDANTVGEGRLLHSVSKKSLYSGELPTQNTSKWDSTVWRTGDASVDQDHIVEVLAIKGEAGKEALGVTYSYEVAELVGDPALSKVEEQAPAQSTGAEVTVSLNKIDFKTDCSTMRPFFAGIAALMTPLKAEKEQEDEINNLQCLVQLMPQVAQDVGKLQEEQDELKETIAKLQDQHAEINLKILRMKGADAEQREQLSSEERMLRSNLRLKRARYTELHKRQMALKKASQASEEKRMISRIAIEVDGGTWHMGPFTNPLARLTMRRLVHIQNFDIKLGVPVVYDFKIHNFVLQSLLTDKWNQEYKHVVGPLHGSDMMGPQNDEEFVRQNACMLHVYAERLAKPKGEQVVFSQLVFEVYPVKIQITEDMYTSLYFFAFPGSWGDPANIPVDGTLPKRVWKPQANHSTLEILQGGELKEIKQHRQFFRLKKHSPRPMEDVAIMASDNEVLVKRESGRFNSPLEFGDDGAGDAAGAAVKKMIKHTPSSGGGAAPKNKDVEELRMRAMDQIEFSSVSFTSSLTSENSLQVSVSYKGRSKGRINVVPDIDALVVNIPEVKFPKPNEGPITCSWQKLYQMFFMETRWTVVTQVSRSIWSKVKWRRKMGAGSTEEGDDDQDNNHSALLGYDASAIGSHVPVNSLPKLMPTSSRQFPSPTKGRRGSASMESDGDVLGTYGRKDARGTSENKWRSSALQQASSTYGRTPTKASRP